MVIHDLHKHMGTLWSVGECCSSWRTHQLFGSPAEPEEELLIMLVLEYGVQLMVEGQHLSFTQHLTQLFLYLEKELHRVPKLTDIEVPSSYITLWIILHNLNNITHTASPQVTNRINWTA